MHDCSRWAPLGFSAPLPPPSPKPLQQPPLPPPHPNTPFASFEKLDAMILDATEAGLWVILTARGQVAAGQYYDSDPMRDVFNNETLAEQMYTAWAHVAEHYSTWANIAAYEILSEPRDKDATSEQISSFYAGGCAATQSADPRTPCMVGPGSYYKLWLFNDDMLLPNNNNVIYTW